jgi:hypothetical protein
MQSLDVLEAVGKKAIETLELDEKQIQQSIEQLALSVHGLLTQRSTSHKPVPSTFVLLLPQEDVPGGEENAGKKASPPAAASPKPVVRNKVVTFESNFEDSYGKAHLEVTSVVLCLA